MLNCDLLFLTCRPAAAYTFYFLHFQGKSDSLQKADLLTEWWVGERVWGWIIADTELFPSGVTTVSECLLCSVLHYR